MDEVPYRLKIMGGIIASELMMLMLVVWWPVQQRERPPQEISYSESEIAIEQIQITTQESSPPPPPTPQVPVPVPDDQIIEEDPIVLEEIDLLDLPNPMEMEGTGVLGDADRVASSPHTPPSVVRIVEPTVPEAAKKADIKAEIWVSFLVDKEGRVEEASIAQIKVYDDKVKFSEIVDRINYGLPEATLEAALRWRFRPAQNNGEPVRAYTRHIFTYGF
ncbi:MAG: hypothetical protein R3281_17125 [Balneolaceae bacterium]|nr:hypothetical protein [Balneolaceae bacterium]